MELVLFLFALFAETPALGVPALNTPVRLAKTIAASWV